MKRKIAKTVFFVGCVAAFIFLLLPFLETTPPPEPAQLKAQPQVATENPLAALAQRFGSLFKRHSERHTRAGQVPPGAGTPQTDNELYTPMLAAANANRHASGATTQSTQPAVGVIQLPPSSNKLDFGNAAVQTDNGEWVLVRQTAPAGSRPGMHEVNVHENPYERYIRQERARQFQPQKRMQEIPDSKWARLIRPIKQFFGLDEETPVSSAGLLASRPGAQGAALEGANNKLADTPRQPGIGPARLGLPDISARQWLEMSIPQRERHSVAQFNELISGTRAAEEAAEMMAEAKYPDAHTKKQKDEKERYKQEMLARNKEAIKNGILQQMENLSQNKEPVDELANVMSCKNASLPAPVETCDMEHAGEPSAAVPEDEKKIEQQQNAADFFEQTKYYLPKDLPLTPVLGPTDPESLVQMSSIPADRIQKTAEIYQFLYDQQHCDTNTCYWVANSTQIDPQLTDAVAMSNAKLKPDPENTYPTYQDNFIREKVKQLGKEATEEQVRKARRDAALQWKANAVHYVPYTADQLKQVQTKTLTASNPANPSGNTQDITVLFVTDPALAPQVAHDINSVIFGYNQTPLATSTTPQEAGRQITNALAQNVNDAKQVINSVTRTASQEYIRAKINQEISQPNPGGAAGWEGIFKNFREGTNGNSPK